MSRKKRGNPVSGWICLDKPYGLGSTQAVAAIRRRFNAQKAGHAGTLDPLASGILPIALGEATKTVAFLMDADKTYRVLIRWGEATRTLDAEGEVTARSAIRPTLQQVEAVLPRFVGWIEQVPPAFSAIKIDGERAYDLARSGIEFDLKARKVRVDAIRVLGQPDDDHLDFEMDCGKGTYVRSLVRDLAEAVGALAHVAQLRRTRVGRFDETNAITLEKLDNLVHTPALLGAMLPVATALDDIPDLAVTAEEAFRLTQGRSVVLLPKQADSLKSQVNPASLSVSASRDGQLVALCKLGPGQLNPVRIFHMNPSGD